MEANRIISIILSIICWITHFGQLTPVEIVPTVEFKDEGVVDLRLCPDFAIQAEEKEEEKTEEISGVNLYL